MSAASAALLSAALLTATFAVAAPASASSQPGLTVGLNQTVTKTFPGIPVSDTARVDTAPDDCKTLPSCDTIPLALAVPTSRTVYDDYRLKVELQYTTQRSQQGQTNAQTVFLDLYLWNDPAGNAAISQSTSGTPPQSASIERPALGKYQIVVHNASGVNDQYTIKATLVFVPGSKPAESVEDPSRRLGGDDNAAAATPTGQSSQPTFGGTTGAKASDLAVLPPLSAPSVATPVIGVPPTIDPSLTGIQDATGVLSSTRSILRRPATVAASGRVPAAVLVFWLAVVPVAVTVFFVVVVLRRRPAVLSHARAA